ncbi:MAG: glutamate formimidoyltransferase [Stygiobacter sp. RIFOXYC12_FULL_38_8]|nr:MAG: glutamate formimidoyltransferase [Stygiobacter sp. GWC2_38_9]OGU80780.1 MAG: glutamate formimidoyltransferase [Stygiobacter sp. RIFOXYA12_FULL_38_9]OGV06106.1 MAG: glutamate formimidoyltransferase [Stygiobacter sp. RIFOXYB2_FULL_37_11]OGV16829.1 MAG: glutamate formimidoyltransferase [Stygiobacter sp. RIFOXYC2_FULL_38_25]OGV23459.1 MAG: glutamate formimidoyltransferase [Stygiobacter sp. RIFOXYC12_FULL_38_8]OGV82820.1 MAG: glutamate formimidoyltransferase [Stygiobacter sp. GWF2_38_21]OG
MGETKAKIIECVPNFSEGRDQKTFDAIKEALASTSDVKLLSLEPDADYNRVVVTIAGNETGILNGAVNACRAAANCIDMRNHKGEHPRLGAIDVVPFVPVSNVTTEECVKISEQFAEIISKELNVPVYLYEAAARKPERKSLPTIRQGEYEGLEAKLQDPNWAPDFGEAFFNPKLGGIVTGSRFFLVAYNVNINSTDVKYAKEIGEVLRESGYSKRDENGAIIKVEGKPIKVPGRLKEVKGMGVSLEKYNLTQVSMNLTNYTITPIHVAFEEVKKEAARLGVTVTGSEIVGLVPLASLLEAGKFYTNNKEINENKLVEVAIENLGLSSLNPFKPEEKIIEYLLSSI